MKVCIVSFSGRKAGNCARIAREIGRCLQDEEVTLFDLSEHTLHPCGQCRGECFSDRRACPHMDDVEYGMLDALTHADLAYLVVPNHCGYPNALYFAFNERSLCYFSGREALLEQYVRVRKRFILVSGGETARFGETFRQQTDGAAPDMLVLSAKDYGRRSIAGDLMDDSMAREVVRAFVARG